MKMIAKVTLAIIEEHLISHGGGNHQGNLRELGLSAGSTGFKHYLAEPTIGEFYALVFQHDPSLTPIVPNADFRPLRVAAENALIILPIRPQLNSNWDLKLTEQRTSEWLATGSALPIIALRDSRGNEPRTGPWYIQDGCHRALGYAMAMLKNGLAYVPVEAYIATKMRLPRL